jgi:hypothetical protein
VYNIEGRDWEDFAMIGGDMQLVIGLCGKAGSGKGEVAKILDKHFSTYVLPFARPLKRMAIEFGWDGKKDEKGRKFLQMLGTEIGRAYNTNHWVDCWKVEANKALKETETGFGPGPFDPRYQIIVADDVRFDNEGECIHSYGGINIRMVGRAYDLGDNSTHASESGLNPLLIDGQIDNSGTVEHLEQMILTLINTYYKVKG